MARQRADRHPKNTKTLMQQANMMVMPEVYYSKVYLTSGVAAFLILVFSGAIAGFFYGSTNFGLLLVPVFLLPLLIAALVCTYGSYYPEQRAKKRQIDIDLHLPYALSYLSALASAGAPPVEMFKSLARHREIYGELSVEALKIYRDVFLFGNDIVVALRDSAGGSPSQRYRIVAEGIVSTTTAGGDLKSYLKREARECIKENRSVVKSFMETMGAFAEAYTVVGVAFPLFMIILFSIALFLSTSNSLSSPKFLYIMVFVMLPVVSLVFTWLIKGAMPEA